MAAPSAPSMEVVFANDLAAMSVFLATQRRLRWRRRLLPAIAVICIFAIWSVAVTALHVKPFIAPSPLAVVQVFRDRLDIMVTNLVPTVIEALLGFVLGNFA